MGTMATMVERVRDDLNRGTAYDARIRLAILRAIRHYRTEQFAFNRARYGFNFTPGSAYVTFPADWQDTIRVILDRGTGQGFEPLDPVPIGLLDDWDRDRSADNGEPCYYATDERRLRVYPAPDETYSAELTYYSDLIGSASASLSDSFSCGWFTEGEHLICTWALAEINSKFIDGPEAKQRARELLGEAEIIRASLIRGADQEQSGGTIRPCL